MYSHYFETYMLHYNIFILWTDKEDSNPPKNPSPGLRMQDLSQFLG